ncbi:hypothetical protein SLEP1_g19522 [Rubroshorea leprosula]|uniref:Cytochrome P450 n=1 Tax=Rubroshorea leprosula TaxID=152421 RepID=A0AAV5J5M9_9ROSI|nr:hypothetical protein SLEP1_g19522 [Rubroshorea leprosula]
MFPMAMHFVHLHLKPTLPWDLEDSLKGNSASMNLAGGWYLPGVLHNIGRLHDFSTEVLERGKGTLQFRGPWEIFEGLGDGIFNSDGDLWKTQQKALHSLIKKTKFELAVQRILTQKLERGLIPILESCSVLDMQDVFHRLTFDIICLLVFGFDPNCISIEFPSVSCEKAYDVMEEAALHHHFVPTGFWKLQRLLQVGEENKLGRAWETFDKFLYEQILLNDEKLSTKNAEKEEEFDLLTAFMFGESGEKSRKKSNRFLRDTAFSLLAAGRDTVASALVWLLWLVATHIHLLKRRS